jgi:hypothetical protein
MTKQQSSTTSSVKQSSKDKHNKIKSGSSSHKNDKSKQIKKEEAPAKEKSELLKNLTLNF